MGVILNHPCMSHQDFEDYKKELEAVKHSSFYKHVHYGEREHWIWPALIITLVEYGRDEGGYKTQINYMHTSVSQNRLLKVLGLAKEEIKVEFNGLSLESVPESFENREV